MEHQFQSVLLQWRIILFRAYYAVQFRCGKEVKTWNHQLTLARKRRVFRWIYRSTLGQPLTQIWLVHLRNHVSLYSRTKPHYSREQLLSIRSSCYSTKWLFLHLLYRLKDLKILKYRGKEGGKRVYKEDARIPTISKRRIITQRNTGRRANLQNRRSLKRTNVNKEYTTDLGVSSEVHISERSTPGLTSGLKILHLNILSLRNISHLSQLRELNNREIFHIVTVAETWLNTTITSAEIKLDGYKSSSRSVELCPVTAQVDLGRPR